MKKILKKINISPIIALLVAFVIGGIFLALCGYNPFYGYQAMFAGAFGTKNGIFQVLLKTTPLVFCGLAASIGFRSGVFNIGIEGQLYMGAMSGALVGIYVKGLPALIHIPLAMAAGCIGGAVWAFIPAILKLKRNAHEFVTTIMLNYIAVLLTNFLVNYPFKAEGMTPQTEVVNDSARIARILPKNQLTWSILFALAAMILVYLFFQYTAGGFEMGAVGENPSAALAEGISVSKVQVQAMVLSGAVAGLGGCLEVMGTYGRFIQEFAADVGYNGVAVAILGNNNPIGVLLGSLLFGSLNYGGTVMTRSTGIASEFIEVVQAIVILVVSAPALMAVCRKRKGR